MDFTRDSIVVDDMYGGVEFSEDSPGILQLTCVNGMESFDVKINKRDALSLIVWLVQWVQYAERDNV